MAKFDSFWNNKLGGVGGFFILVFSRCGELVNDKLAGNLAKRNLGRIGKRVTILRGFKYRNPANIFLGNDVTIGRNVVFTSEISQGKITLDDNVVIGRNCNIDFSGDIHIGEGTLLSEGVVIQSHDHGLDPRSKPTGRKLVIGKNVWVGLNAMILSNVHEIGDNAIIAAGSIVTKPVPDNSIVGGAPAKFIKHKTAVE